MDSPEQNEKIANKRDKYLDISWSAIGATIGIAIALWFVSNQYSPFLLVSLGGSTVFLFALSETDAAQPRALFGGHLGGAVIGIQCLQFFGDTLWASVFAQDSPLCSYPLGQVSSLCFLSRCCGVGFAPGGDTRSGGGEGEAMLREDRK